MSFWFSDQARLMALVVGCGALWTLESFMPLYVYEKRRVRRALPNIALTAMVVLTNLLLSFGIATLASFIQQKRLGLFYLSNLSTWLLGVLGVVALDLFTWCAHVLMHKSWWGWQFHRVHHSDTEVNVTTAFRQHPGETVWRVVWYALAIAVFGIPMWVVIIYLVASTLNAQFEHTNIKLTDSVDGPLRLLFVTPNMHKVHHSREQRQTDTNYANIFSLWDQMFGTYTATTDFRSLRYGLDGFDDAQRQTLTALLRTPFVSSS